MTSQILNEYNKINGYWNQYTPSYFVQNTNFRFVRCMSQWGGDLLEEVEAIYMGLVGDVKEKMTTHLADLLAAINKNISIYESKKDVFAKQDFASLYEKKSIELNQKMEEAKRLLEFSKANLRPDNKEGFIQDQQNIKQEIRQLEGELSLVGLFGENLYEMVYGYSIKLRTELKKYTVKSAQYSENRKGETGLTQREEIYVDTYKAKAQIQESRDAAFYKERGGKWYNQYYTTLKASENYKAPNEREQENILEHLKDFPEALKIAEAELTSIQPKVITR